MYTLPRIQFLDNLTGKWAKQWSISWFVASLIIVTSIFFYYTKQTMWDLFYLGVSIIGLCCVLALSFRKNIAGNGFGIVANIGEVITQSRHGAAGLVLFPIFAMISHAISLRYWSNSEDDDGNMIPKSATAKVWLLVAVFIIIGLSLFPIVNTWLVSMDFGITEKNDISVLGMNFFWINVIAFVLAVTAQTTMTLRYSFNWLLWMCSNSVWIVVNLMTHNYIFAAQMLMYLINAVIGFYEWSAYHSNTNPKK